MRPLQGAEGDAVAPGAKVLLAGASVKAGIMLVDSRSLKVLLLPPHAQDYYLLLGYKFAAMAQSGARVKSHSLAFKNLTMSEGTQASRFVLVLDRQCCLNDNISGSCLGRSLHCHLFRSGISPCAMACSCWEAEWRSSTMPGTSRGSLGAAPAPPQSLLMQWMARSPRSSRLLSLGRRVCPRGSLRPPSSHPTATGAHHDGCMHLPALCAVSADGSCQDVPAYDTPIGPASSIYPKRFQEGMMGALPLQQQHSRVHACFCCSRA